MNTYLVCNEDGGVIEVMQSDKGFKWVYKNTIGMNIGAFLVELDDISAIIKARKFIHASDWRRLDTDELISSVDVGLRVLHDRDFNWNQSNQLLAMIENIAKMLWGRKK